MTHQSFSRRGFLTAAAVATGALAAPRAVAFGGRTSLLDHARAALVRHRGSISHDDVVGLADFSPASKNARLHLVNMRSGRHVSLLVAHGRGSDPSHSGFLHRFSNEEGSNCTSQGAYRTSDYYVGTHGRSMRLDGLEASNSNARSRAIVVHGAWYVSEDMIRDHGVLGRSEGCFAVAEHHLDKVLKYLGPGRLLVAGKF